MQVSRIDRRLIPLMLAAGSWPAWAQTEPAADARPAPQRIEVLGSRTSDTEQRRQSTAAAIVVGREEIERHGDTSLSDVLKRLPGITVPGAPGRGGSPRMRGLGAGYTQILIDGQRAPQGFSLDSLSPEQIERIEILRAPTAETGARAMAGTIHIITREGFTRRFNDLKLGAGTSGGRPDVNASWARNGGDADFSYNTVLNAHAREPAGVSTITTRGPSAADPAATLVQQEQLRWQDRRFGINGNARLQWRLGSPGHTLMLMPLLSHQRGRNLRDGDFATLAGTPGAGDRDETATRSRSDFASTFGRLNGQWRYRVPDGPRLEALGALSGFSSRNEGFRETLGGSHPRRIDDDVHTRQRAGSLTLKSVLALGERHELTAGTEFERIVRRERALGVGTDEGDNLDASSVRTAAFVQDEWKPSPNWALQPGLRWETIATEVDDGSSATVHHRSAVWSPMLHTVWRPQPASRDQVRLSLAGSYKPPTLGQLIPRTTRSIDNGPTRPDRSGNASLVPERAFGVDLAFERYPSAGGVLSANLFHRRLHDAIRNVVALESGRWVSRPRNIGDATVQGVELEAKFRLDQWWSGAPRIDLRGNAGVFRSRVESVPPPDNRLDQQPRGVFNLGADYRFTGLGAGARQSLQVGGNLGYTRGGSSRIADNQWAYESPKRLLDAYALWTLDPTLAWRLSVSNLLARDHLSSTRVAATEAETLSRGRTSWQLRLEMKL